MKDNFSEQGLKYHYRYRSDVQNLLVTAGIVKEYCGKQEKKETGTIELTVTVEEYRQILYLSRGILKRNIQKKHTKFNITIIVTKKS